MNSQYVYFPQDIAGILKSAKLSWKDFWPTLSHAKQEGRDVELSTNVIDFACSKNRDAFQVSVNFVQDLDVWLSESEFQQEVPNWVAGGPDEHA